MMSDAELEELAADIEENGQREPVLIALIDGEKVLVDGRNRLAACFLAQQEPVSETTEVATLIRSRNVYRRHLTPAERAAALRDLIKPALRKAIGNWPGGAPQWRPYRLRGAAMTSQIEKIFNERGFVETIKWIEERRARLPFDLKLQLSYLEAIDHGMLRSITPMRRLDPHIPKLERLAAKTSGATDGERAAAAAKQPPSQRRLQTL